MHMQACPLLCLPQDPATERIVTDHKLIALRYLQSWFVIDFLATFPVDYIVRAIEVVADDAQRLLDPILLAALTLSSRRNACRHKNVSRGNRAPPASTPCQSHYEIQGTWMCSIRADCSWTVYNDEAISAIEILRWVGAVATRAASPGACNRSRVMKNERERCDCRVVRVFRIFWILKHFKTFRVRTILGSFMVGTCAVRRGGPGCACMELMGWFRPAVTARVATLSLQRVWARLKFVMGLAKAVAATELPPPHAQTHIPHRPHASLGRSIPNQTSHPHPGAAGCAAVPRTLLRLLLLPHVHAQVPDAQCVQTPARAARPMTLPHASSPHTFSCFCS